jgi:antirestriction protein
MALSLYANPYAYEGKGFYFSSFDEYEKKAEKSGLEEFEIDFIDGDDVEQKLFKGMKVNQSNLEEYFDALDDLDEDDVIKLVILTDDMGYDVEDAMDKLDDLVVYGEFDSDKDFAYEYVDGIGSLSDALGDNIQNYFDYEAFGRDLRLGGDLDDPDADEDEEQWWEGMSDEEIGEHYADDLGWDGIGKNNLEQYFDWDKFARDLMFDMSEHDGVYYDPNSI